MLHRKKETGYPSIDKTHLRNTKFWERHPFIPPVNISTAIDWVSRGHLDEPVIRQRDLIVTRGEYITDAKIVAKALIRLGVKKGDIVAAAIPNLYQGLVFFKAANSIGAAMTFLNNEATENELLYYLDMYKTPLLVVYDKDREFGSRFINRSDCTVKKVVNIEKQYVDSRYWNKNDYNLDIDTSGWINYHNLAFIASGIKLKKFDLRNMFDNQKDALILYTSGSTGEPKNIVFSDNNIMAAMIYNKNSTSDTIQSNHSWMGVVPFTYPYGFTCSTLTPILGGFRAILTPGIGPKNINEYYSQQPTWILGSPTHFGLVKKYLSPDIDMSGLKMFVSGGDYFPPSQAREAVALFQAHGAKDVRACNGSGNGELLGCSTNPTVLPYRPDTAGKLITGPSYLVMNTDTLEEVKYNENGELWVTGKHVFKRYFAHPEQTRAAKIKYRGQVYFRTGNYGFMDRDGYFTIVGRALRFTSVVGPGGGTYKVHFGRIQQALNDVEIVYQCAAVPVPDKKTIHAGKAYVILKDGIAEDDQTKQYIFDQLRNPPTGKTILKPYEIPKYISFVKEFPLTAAEKIDYAALQKQAESELSA